MKLIRDLPCSLFKDTGCAATIGSFDGLHRGHQAILNQLYQQELPKVLVTFEPLPSEYFALKRSRIMTLRDKLNLLKQLDLVLCLRFNRALAAMSAQEFVQRILVQGLNIKYLIIGDDFHFGNKREGDIKFLKQAGQRYGFLVESIDTVLDQDLRIGSSRVREALLAADFATASKLMHRPYRLSGHVIYDQGLAAQLGFPTANIALRQSVLPVRGVFVVHVYGLNKQPLFGVAHIGARPSVGLKAFRLEVHILNFNADIYGQYLVVEPLKKIREEQRFDSLEALKRQIEFDIQAAKKIISHTYS